MTIRAYQEIYLNNAQAALGDAFDYAVNSCNISGNDFIKLFLVSSISSRMEKGEPAVIAGKSGIDLAQEIILETKGKPPQYTHHERLNRSKEYWIGWAIAYYQWYSDIKYRDVFKLISYEELENMYYTLHEADITKFVDIMNAKFPETFPDTHLKRIRHLYGCTQAELAERSGVSLRSIQMYEQRNKNINKASADTVYRLAKVLGCPIEDLLERENICQ
ncbi:MAG: helix-turn-helix transcriptional regulator [Firmicutes bacterium]|nr:helix-turn-helix transcriptional regulator [Bacillota bacterium]